MILLTEHVFTFIGTSRTPAIMLRARKIVRENPLVNGILIGVVGRNAGRNGTQYDLAFYLYSEAFTLESPYYIGEEVVKQEDL